MFVPMFFLEAATAAPLTNTGVYRTHHVQGYARQVWVEMAKNHSTVEISHSIYFAWSKA
ncbi:MAG: hypothetical protein KatS3mg040_1611 [Candidatus Kapaibacterium sp.]|nr:MAG: hypothetical protein KatS3mg040_1611 [Candidatus Kapabacteria bacterium]